MKTLYGIELIDLDTGKFTAITSLCKYICNCPREIAETSLTCNNCVGHIEMEELKQIQPNLTKDNLETTVNIWKVLLE